MFQFCNNNNLNYTEDILSPEFKKHKGQVVYKRIKSAIKNNVRTTCKKYHKINYYTKTCTFEL